MAARVGFLVLGVALLLAAVVLGWLAFTRFGPAVAQDASPAQQRAFEAERMHDARVSVALGFAASLALFGAMACHGLARKPPASP